MSKWVLQARRLSREGDLEFHPGSWAAVPWGATDRPSHSSPGTVRETGQSVAGRRVRWGPRGLQHVPPPVSPPTSSSFHPDPLLASTSVPLPRLTQDSELFAVPKLVVKIMCSRARVLDLNPASTVYLLRDLEQVTLPLWATSVKKKNKNQEQLR